MAKAPGFAKALPAAGAIVEMDNWDSHSLCRRDGSCLANAAEFSNSLLDPHHRYMDRRKKVRRPASHWSFGVVVSSQRLPGLPEWGKRHVQDIGRSGRAERQDRAD